MLGGVILVQQIEGHVLQPFLMGRFVSRPPARRDRRDRLRRAGRRASPARWSPYPWPPPCNAVVQHLASRHRRRRGRPDEALDEDIDEEDADAHPSPRKKDRCVTDVRTSPWPTSRRPASCCDGDRHPHADGGVALAVRRWPAGRSRSSARTSSAPARSRPAAPTSGSPGSVRGRARHGVVAASAGNHAQGVALAAQLLGIKADRVHARGRADPQGEGDPGVRRRRGLPRPLPRGRPGRGARVLRRDRRGADPPVRPRRHRGRAGHRGLEILEQAPDVKTVLVPTGGGGLLAGIAIAVKAHPPRRPGRRRPGRGRGGVPGSLAAGRPGAARRR